MQKVEYRGVRGCVVGTLLGISGLILSPGVSQAGMTDDLMDTTKHPVSVTMAMQADSFFGFNPAIYGTYGLTDNVALAFSVTYWTAISGIGVHNNNPWLETDMGLNLTFLDKRLSITCLLYTSCGSNPACRGYRRARREAKGLTRFGVIESGLVQRIQVRDG